MKNKTIAIYGIGTYIFSVIASATDTEGNPAYPVAIILLSGIASFLFFIMAIIRLWKQAKNISIIYASSAIILFILSVIQEIISPSYGSPLIILCNIAKVIHFIAFVWAIAVLIHKPRIEGEEREICLAYSKEVSNILAFWDRESTIFNNTLTKYLDSISKSPMAASESCKAAKQLVQAAQEVIYRHEAVNPVPNAAMRMRCAYITLFLSLKEWAVNNCTVIETLANGLSPHYEYAQLLTDRRESAMYEAQNEEIKTLKQLGLTVPEIETFLKQLHSSLKAAEDDIWQPEPCDYEFSNNTKGIE
jgi:hypothetical protein